jgi:hypothetical protein
MALPRIASRTAYIDCAVSHVYTLFIHCAIRVLAAILLCCSLLSLPLKFAAGMMSSDGCGTAAASPAAASSSSRCRCFDSAYWYTCDMQLAVVRTSKGVPALAHYSTQSRSCACIAHDAIQHPVLCEGSTSKGGHRLICSCFL